MNIYGPLTLASQLVSSFEGCSLSPYRCPAGKWTIGIGSTQFADGSPVKATTPPITVMEADRLLTRRLNQLYHGLAQRVDISLTSYEWAALLSLAYNIGLSAFEGSTLLVMLNKGDRQSAANEFLRWDKAHTPDGSLVVLPGLQKRRQSERAVFLGYPFEP